MGTRSDYYVGRGKDAEWLGSRAYDGYPDGVDAAIRMAETEEEFRAAVFDFLDKHDDSTLPEQGWPWPWEDSRTTDFAYAFEAGHVYASNYGREWFRANEPEPDEDEEDRPKSAVFPDMSSRQNVTYDGRSGLLIVRKP